MAKKKAMTEGERIACAFTGTRIHELRELYTYSGKDARDLARLIDAKIRVAARKGYMFGRTLDIKGFEAMYGPRPAPKKRPTVNKR